MNRASGLTILGLAFLAAASDVAEAQMRGGVSGGWGGVVLLVHPQVQEELKLDQSQLDKTRDLVDEMREKQKTMFAQLEGLAGEERSKKAREIAASQAEEGIKALGLLLRPEQFARFRQVDLQQRGASAFTDPKVAGELELTPDQSEKLGSVVDRSVLRLREAPSKTRGDRRAAMELVRTIRKETDAEAVALLTDAQKEAWKRLIGGPLELSANVRAVR